MLFKRQFRSPIGTLTLIASDEAMRALILPSEDPNGSIEKLIKKTGEAVSPASDKHKILDWCERELRLYFAGKLSHFSVPIDVKGTPFQLKVWSALSKIPYGKTISYGEQAQSLRRRTAVRAVAAANGCNPLAILIPCHRVIASTGHLHGYGGGLPLKQQLLELEGVKVKNSRVHL